MGDQAQALQLVLEAGYLDWYVDSCWRLKPLKMVSKQVMRMLMAAIRLELEDHRRRFPQMRVWCFNPLRIRY